MKAVTVQSPSLTDSANINHSPSCAVALAFSQMDEIRKTGRRLHHARLRRPSLNADRTAGPRLPGRPPARRGDSAPLLLLLGSGCPRESRAAAFSSPRVSDQGLARMLSRAVKRRSKVSPARPRASCPVFKNRKFRQNETSGYLQLNIISMPFFPEVFSDTLLSFLLSLLFTASSLHFIPVQKAPLSVRAFVLAVCSFISIFCSAFPVNLHISSAVSLFSSFQQGFFIVVSFFKFFLHR